MADRNTTGAVHLTSLDLDISGVQKSLNEVKESVESTAQQVRDSFSNATKDITLSEIDTSKIASSSASINNISKSFTTTRSAIESLNLSYKTFLNTISKSKLQDNLISDIAKNAKESAKEMQELTSSVQDGVPITKEQSEQYRQLQSTLKTLKGELKDTETTAIQTGQGFKQAGENAETFGQKIESALLKLADRAKLMMSYQLIGLIQNALGQVVSTIQTTEDAVVDLQRVLTETISTSTISDELYQIASDFGQTFENVQEVAVRFAQTGMGWQEVVDATRATMLGLNTAELEVSTATEGLIATINQFNIPASEMETVIDKINITADNFPVTSEKIVAALQRAGGTASAFNMTLDETIATITTLAAQTGRSGENIGTALNSLIIYTSKAENLELFSGLSGQMDEVVKKYQAGSASILDVWTQLGDEISKLSDKQAEALFNSETYEEFASTFESEAAEYASTIQEIYETAGTYRRNYLTVLLQDIGNVEEVMAGMSDAEGYSLSENEKYMDTLTARWNQLVLAAQELAVQFGEEGFIDFLKFLTSASAGALKLLKDIGGLNTIILSLVAALAAVKKQKIIDLIADAPSKVKNLISSFKNLVSQLNFVKTAQESYNLALQNGATKAQAFATAAGSILGVVGILATAIFAGVNAWNSYQQSLENARQESIAQAEESKKSAQNIYELYQEYLKAQSVYDESQKSTENLASASEALREELQKQKVDVSGLTGDWDEYNKKIKEVTLTELEKSLLSQAEAVQKAEESIKSAFTGLFGVGELVLSFKPDDNGSYQEYGEQFTTIERFKEIYKELLDVKEQIVEKYGPEKAVYTDIYQEVTNLINKYEPYITTLEDATARQEELSREIENVKNNTIELSDATNGLNDALSGSSAIDYAAKIEALNEQIENLGESFDKVSGDIDSFQSAYSTLIDVISEYNETGIMTADMLQQLLEMEPQYIEMLDVKTDSLGINKNAVDNLVNANDIYLQQIIALKVAEEADSLATSVLTAQKDGLTVAELNAAYAGQNLQAALQEAIMDEINGTGTSYDLANAIRAVGEEAGLSGQYLDYFVERIGNYANTVTSLYGKIDRGNIRTYYTPKVSTPKSGSTKNPAIEAEKENLQNEVDSLKKQKESINEQYKEIEKNLKKQKELSDDYYDGILDNLKELKESSDKYYDGLIDNLRQVQEENDRINAQIDYYTDRQKLLRNIEQAQSRSGIEWREKEADYQQQLVDLDEEWRRKQEDWELEDQINELERLKELAQDVLDAQISEMQKLKEAAQDLIEDQLEGYKDERDAIIKGLDDEIAKLQESIQALSKSISSAASSGISSGVSSGVASANSSINNFASSTTKTFAEMCAELNRELNTALDPEKISKKLRSAYVEAMQAPKETALQMLDFNIKYAESIQKQVSQSTQSQKASVQNGFLSPMQQGISSIAQQLSEGLVNASQISASNMRKAYENNFISPVRQQIANLNSGLANTISSQISSATSRAQQIVNNANNVNMYNNINSVSSANSTMNSLNSILNNPLRLGR